MTLLTHLKAGLEKSGSCVKFRHFRGLVGGKTMGVDFIWDLNAVLFAGSLVSGPLLFLGFESASSIVVRLCFSN